MDLNDGNRCQDNMSRMPARKALRLSDYDYSRNGVYFLTICTHNRVCCLSDVGAHHDAPGPAQTVISLTAMGSVVERTLLDLPVRYPHIRLIKYVIMPNHVHLLLEIHQTERRAHRDAPLRNGKTNVGQKRSDLAKIIGFMKMNATKEIRKTYPGFPLWQSRYYDHIVRNEADFLRILKYIETNPAKWAEDRYFIP